MKLVNHWRSLSYFFFPPLFLHVSTALTVTKTFSACLFDFSVGRTNPGTVGAALTSCCSGDSGSWMQLLCTIPDSSSAAQSSSVSFGLSKWPFQFSQSSVSEMLSGVLSSSLSTGWLFIVQSRRIFKIWVLTPGRSFADQAGGKGDLSDSLNAAAPSCGKSEQDALMISFVSEMYPMAVICVFWVQDSFCVACMFWLPCHISKMSWTLAILCNFLSSASFFISESFSVFLVSNSGPVSAKIPLLARTNCLTMTFSRTVSPVVFDCLQQITSQWMENWPPLRHRAVWQRICCALHWRDRRTMSAFPSVVVTNRLCPVSKMYNKSPLGRSGNHWDLDLFAPVLWYFRRRIQIEPGGSQ